MSTREYAIDLINSLSDEQIDAFINFINVLTDRSVIAKMESKAIALDPNPKTYSSFKEFMDEMEKEDNE